MAAARAGAIEPAAVELVPTPGGGVVVITLASDELPAAMVGVMTQTASAWGLRHDRAVDGRAGRAGIGLQPGRALPAVV